MQHPVKVMFASREQSSFFSDKFGFELDEKDEKIVVINGVKIEDSCRVVHKYSKSEDEFGIQIQTLIETSVSNVPKEVEGTVYIVPFMVAKEFKERSDIWCMGKQIRGNGGKPSYSLGFVKVEH